MHREAERNCNTEDGTNPLSSSFQCRIILRLVISSAVEGSRIQIFVLCAPGMRVTVDRGAAQHATSPRTDTVHSPENQVSLTKRRVSSLPLSDI